MRRAVPDGLPSQPAQPLLPTQLPQVLRQPPANMRAPSHPPNPALDD